MFGYTFKDILNSKTFTKTITAFILLALLNIGVNASETDVPEELQVSIFIKALSYNTVITSSTSKVVNIGVIVNTNSSKSVANKDNFIENINALKQGIIFFSKETFLSNKSVKAIAINSNSLSDLKKHDISILYLTEDLGSLNSISKFAKENKTLTLSSEPGYVRNGIASVGIMTKNNRPKLILNTTNLKLEGQEFGARVLKFSEVID